MDRRLTAPNPIYNSQTGNKCQSMINDYRALPLAARGTHQQFGLVTFNTATLNTIDVKNDRNKIKNEKNVVLFK